MIYNGRLHIDHRTLGDPDVTTDWVEMPDQGGELFEPVWSIGEALAFLDPPIPRRTLARKLAGLTPAAERPAVGGGPAVRLYRVAEVMKVHAEWAARP